MYYVPQAAFTRHLWNH